jgi:3-isopropylmalate/(R)-2-methylmalate dehydratase small subunit
MYHRPQDFRVTPFSTLSSIVAPLLRDNIDTDTIIPSREMTSTGKTGLASGLFAPWRYADVATRTPNPEFVLNQPAFSSARILAAGINFGCGSSREHAVWALAEYGITCILAESFAPIFSNNCVRNGILCIPLQKTAIADLVRKHITVDLAAQTVRNEQLLWTFSIAPEAKEMLLHGLDAIDLTLTQAHAISQWRVKDQFARPWVYLEQQA